MERLDNKLVLRDLGGGLIVRRSSPADTEALAAFNARIHSDNGPEKPDERLAIWTRDLLMRPHPTFDPDDFTLVEDTATGQIVSAVGLIDQTWAYGGVPFGVGRPELVATAPEYRNRGLVRAQFEIVHQWSAERGQLVQAITGIPFYYRQFGYEMGLALAGGRSGFEPQVPALKAGVAEPYRLRPATEADIAFIAQVYAETVVAREAITCVRSPAEWRYEVDGRSPGSLLEVAVRIIESAAGEPAGYLVHPTYLWEGGGGNALGALDFQLKPGMSWLAVIPSVIRYLWSTGQALGAQAGQPMQRFVFALGAEHPAYDAALDRLPLSRPPYAWYVRVADLPGFLRHVAPVLEERLARSVAAGHSGELKLSFYRQGIRLVLENGRLATCEPWQPTPAEGGNAAFPDLTFLQLLFGYRSLEELRHAYADCWAGGDEPRTVLKALFPKQPANLWPVG